MSALDLQQEYVWTFGDYRQALRRRWGVSAIVGLTILVAGIVIAVAWPPSYRSMGTILIEQQAIPPDLVRSTITSFADQRIQLINQRVMTTANLLDIIRQNGLYREDFDSKPREVIIDRMRRNVHLNMISANVVDPRSGQPTSATIAFTVGFDSPSPQLAVRVANQLTSLYLQQNSETRRQQAAEASGFLADEAKRLGEEIAVLATRVAEFKQKNMDRLPETAALNQQFLSRAEQDLADVRRQRGTLEERRVYIQAQLAQLSRNSPAADAAALDPAERLRILQANLATLEGIYTADHPDVVRTLNAIAALRAQVGSQGNEGKEDAEKDLANLRAERDALLARYEPLHPDVVRIEGRIAAAEARVRDAEAEPAPTTAPRATNPAYIQLSAQLESDAIEREGLNAKEKEIRQRITILEERIAASPAVERDYNQLMRDLESARFKYQEVSAKQREAVVSQNLEMDAKAERFNLIEPPLLPERPVSPNRFLILAMAVVLALVAAIATVAVREMLDSSVRGPADFDRLLGMIPLGIIPAIDTDEDRRQRGRRRIRFVTATAVVVVTAAVLVHMFVRPLDVLWLSALRRLGV